MAHQAFGVVFAIHADQQAPTHGGRLAALLAVAMGKVGIDPRGGRLHGQLAQRSQVGLAEEGIDGGARLFGHVDLALAQALQQFARRQVHQQQFVGFLQDPIGHGFAHLHAGDVADVVVEAFQVLDVDRGVDVDAGGEQLLDVLPALGVAAAGCIAVGQFVHQRQRGRVGEQAVEVHFFEGDATVDGALERLLRQTGEQCFGFGAAVGFDDADAQLDALAQLTLGGQEHGVGLADTRRGAEENLEAATAHGRQVGQQGIGAVGVGHVAILEVPDGARSCVAGEGAETSFPREDTVSQRRLPA